jgi:hypothetical protein
MLTKNHDDDNYAYHFQYHLIILDYYQVLTGTDMDLGEEEEEEEVCHLNKNKLKLKFRKKM